MNFINEKIIITISLHFVNNIAHLDHLTFELTVVEINSLLHELLHLLTICVINLTNSVVVYSAASANIACESSCNSASGLQLSAGLNLIGSEENSVLWSSVALSLEYSEECLLSTE